MLKKVWFSVILKFQLILIRSQGVFKLLSEKRFIKVIFKKFIKVMLKKITKKINKKLTSNINYIVREINFELLIVIFQFEFDLLI